MRSLHMFLFYYYENWVNQNLTEQVTETERQWQLKLHNLELLYLKVLDPKDIWSFRRVPGFANLYG